MHLDELIVSLRRRIKVKSEETRRRIYSSSSGKTSRSSATKTTVSRKRENLVSPCTIKGNPVFKTARAGEEDGGVK